MFDAFIKVLSESGLVSIISIIAASVAIISSVIVRKEKEREDRERPESKKEIKRITIEYNTGEEISFDAKNLEYNDIVTRIFGVPYSHQEQKVISTVEVKISRDTVILLAALLFLAITVILAIVFPSA